jgi:hypothetical protein
VEGGGFGRALARRRLPWPALTVDGVTRPLRIHALPDDASRFKREGKRAIGVK